MLMPIYGHMRANKRRTFLLFSTYILLFLAAGYALGLYLGEPPAGLVLAAVIALVVMLISYYGGQNAITAMAGARPVSLEEEPYLYHTVEGLSIAAGIPVPRAYIIESDIPNAFAAGRKPDKAVVAVTRGLLKRLNRVELEGVLAHEISHIRNYDILIATMAVVLAGTIIFVSEIARRSLWYGGRGHRGRNDGKAQALVMVAVILLAILAPIFARILQFAISRQREYLADAAAAELTGYPEGLAAALEKIAGMQEPGGRLDSKALQSLYIVNPALEARGSAAAAGLFATHPPIQKRIERLRSM
ncbi:MAG: M48 family metalloprotease [Bacillota bacterium]